MSYDEFVELVGKMRMKQKEYFLKRDRAVLVESKVLEKKVDDAIRAFAADDRK